MNFVECVTFLNCCHRKQCDNDPGGIMAKGEIKKVFMVIVSPPPKKFTLNTACQGLQTMWSGK